MLNIINFMFGLKIIKQEKRVDDVNLSTLQKRMTRLEAEMLDLTISLDTIRNKVLRKIQSKKTKDESDNILVDDDGFLKTG